MQGILQTISCYSLLQSPLRLEDLVATAKKRGYQAVALTDRNVLYGAAKFYQLCQQAKIKPLIGLTLQLTSSNEIILLAQNNHGYQNLMKISTLKNRLIANNEAEFSLDQLASFLEDLYVIMPLNSAANSALKQNDQVSAKKYLTQWRQLVLPKNLLIGISPQLDQNIKVELLALADQLEMETIALEPVKYLNPADQTYLQVLRAIDQGVKLQPAEQLQKPAVKEWLRPADEVAQTYRTAGMQPQLQKLEQLCQNVSFQLSFSRPHLPHYPTPTGQTAASYLKQLCQQGLAKRKIEVSNPRQAVYAQRLEHELQVIKRMGFDDYFLIVWDVTNFAHRAKIVIGPGRGSAAGSLVAFALAITDVDPLKYDLLFERFLNEERAQMPDIDLDLPDTRRQEVIAYLQKRYGQEHVAQIITFGTLGARQALRDVGRVLGASQFEMNTWSRLIPHELKIKLKDAWKKSPKLRDQVAISEKNQLIFKTACALEGLPRHFSIHAAGVILSDQQLADLVPLQVGSDGMQLTQYTKDFVEQIGLLKFDFLGLRNLSVLDQTLNFVKKDFDPKFDLRQISLADPQTLQLFKQARTNGIFQFESAGIRNVLRQLQPESFEDLTAVNALFRPGPMENIGHFIARKHQQEPITYPADSLRPILQKTYGILVYQEQVMQVASVMGGFSLGQADLLRRAMSKKKAAQISDLKEKFIKGAKQKGYSKQLATQVYEYIEHFANYGFNRSHAVAYTKMAFELAYLKCHYPAAFLAALLDSVSGDHEKTRAYVLEARQLKLQVLSPNINRSQFGFSLVNQKILFGLGSIRQLRRDFVWTILKERKNGKYQSFQDFLQRMPVKYLKSESLQPLIYSGACDGFGFNRATLIHNLSKILDNILLSGNNVELLTVLAPKIEKVPDFTVSEKITKEVEYLGTFLSAHPVEQYRQLAEIEGVSLVSQLRSNQVVKVLLYVKKIKEIRTKKGEQMAFLSGEDQSGQLEVTIFPNLFRQLASLIPEQVYLITGKVDEHQQRRQIIAVKLSLAATLKTKMKRIFFIRLSAGVSAEKKQLLWQLMKKNPGTNPVIIYEVATHKKIVLSERYWLNDSLQLTKKISQLIGSENVVVKNENN
nr:DNA polymerase III subunit alpha [Liquorilactobacillus sicerae]